MWRPLTLYLLLWHREKLREGGAGAGAGAGRGSGTVTRLVWRLTSLPRLPSWLGAVSSSEWCCKWEIFLMQVIFLQVVASG